MITLYTIVFVLLNFIVLIRGISDGIEKTAKNINAIIIHLSHWYCNKKFDISWC